MPTHYTDTAQFINTRTAGASTPLIPGSTITGQVCLTKSTFIIPASLANGDTIIVTYLPKGAVLVPHLSSVVTDGIGNTLTISLGDAKEPNRFCGSAALGGTGGSKSLASGTDYAANATPLETGTWVQATVTTQPSITANKRATFLLAYTLP